MRFHLISPDLLEGSSNGRSQYRTQANLKNRGSLNPVDKLNLTARLLQLQQAVTRAVLGRRLLRSRTP